VLTWRSLSPLLKISEDIRLPWQELLVEAVIKPGTIHEAYRRFWDYSLGFRSLR